MKIGTERLLRSETLTTKRFEQFSRVHDSDPNITSLMYILFYNILYIKNI